MTGRAVKHGLCGTCHREIPLKRDGRLRAHLALRSSYGRRETCEGSGGHSARVELLGQAAERARDTGAPMSPAAAFNANAEWAKADVLYLEYRDMAECGAASGESCKAAYEAYSRAWDDARTLAPHGPVWTYQEQSEAV